MYTVFFWHTHDVRVFPIWLNRHIGTATTFRIHADTHFLYYLHVYCDRRYSHTEFFEIYKIEMDKRMQKKQKVGRTNPIISTNLWCCEMQYRHSTQWNYVCQFDGDYAVNRRRTQKERIFIVTKIDIHLMHRTSQRVNEMRQQRREKVSFYIQFHWNLKRKFFVFIQCESKYARARPCVCVVLCCCVTLYFLFHKT